IPGHWPARPGRRKAGSAARRRASLACHSLPQQLEYVVDETDALRGVLAFSAEAQLVIAGQGKAAALLLHEAHHVEGIDRRGGREMQLAAGGTGFDAVDAKLQRLQLQ